jgi:hypothetical protein
MYSQIPFAGIFMFYDTHSYVPVARLALRQLQS